jgi:excisionase family DNA binding protein
MTQDESNSSEEWLSPVDAAAKLGVNSRRVYRLISKGKLNSRGPRGEMKISLQELQGYLNQGREAGRAYVVGNDGDFDSDRFDIGSSEKNRKSGNNAASRSGSGRSSGGSSDMLAALAVLQNERQQLMSRIEQVEAQRVADWQGFSEERAKLERELGTLGGRITELERQLGRAESSVTNYGRVIFVLLLALFILLVLSVVAAVIFVR